MSHIQRHPTFHDVHFAHHVLVFIWYLGTILLNYRLVSVVVGKIHVNEKNYVIFVFPETFLFLLHQLHFLYHIYWPDEFSKKIWPVDVLMYKLIVEIVLDDCTVTEYATEWIFFRQKVWRDIQSFVF